MSANPTLYADSLSSSRSPSSVFHSISTRLSLSRALTADLAAYYHERALLEDAYVKGLKKLESRLHSAGKETVFKELDAVVGGLDGGQRQADQILGSGLSGVRKTLEGEVGEVARVHEIWRKKISEEVERSLRDSLGGGEWIGWNRGEEQLRGNVKEYEGLVEKVQKAQTKSTRSAKPSSKLLTTQSALSSLGSTLTSSLPAFLTQSQALDLSHSAFLKEALVRAGTASSDLGRERMEGGEKVLVTVLGVDESADAEEWALREGMRLGGGGATAGASRANGFGLNGAGLASVGEFGETESVVSGGAPPPTTFGNSRTRQETGASSDAASTRSGSIAAAAPSANIERSRTTSRPPPPAAPLPLPTTNDRSDTRSSHTVEQAPKEKEKKGLGGKLSSILGGGGGKSRDRSSSIPNSAKYANFNSTTAPDAPPVPTVSTPSLAAPQMDRRESGGSDLLGGSSAGYGGAAPLQPEPTGQGQREKRKSLMPSLSGEGGGLFRRQSKMSSLNNDYDSVSSPLASASATGGGPSGGAQFAQHLSAEPAGAGAGGSPRVDSEGFSVPPEGYDRPITGAGGANLMDDDEENFETPASVPRLSIAPSSSSPFSQSPSSAAPILSQESEADRLAALKAVQSTLGAPSTGLSRRGTARGRRSEGGAPVRNTMYGTGSLSSSGSGGAGGLEPPSEEGLVRRGSVASDDDVPLAVVQQQHAGTHRRAPPPPPASSAFAAAASSPPLPPAPQSATASPTFASTPTTPSFAVVPPPAPASVDGGRTMSILSTSSSLASSTLAGGRADPFALETTPGLRAEVRETVNVLLKGGEAVKVMVAGEVSVSYRPSAGQAAAAKESVKVRFSGLEGAEKTAPNPAYLQPGASPTEFNLLLSALLARQGATTTVLKYALALPTSAVAVPITVKPTWRCEPGLSRAIVAYSVNKDSTLFQASGGASPFGEDDSSATAKLEDVSVTLHLAPTSPVSISSFQSKPGAPVASLLPSSRGIAFNLGTLTPGGTEEKLLASLQTDPGAGAAVPGQVEVRWVVRGKTVGRVGVEVLDEEVGGQQEELREVRRETVAGTYKAA
ncbi:hypothetical protein JCM11251_007687 [Rhodosporidiobolus azoricus]